MFTTITSLKIVIVEEETIVDEQIDYTGQFVTMETSGKLSTIFFFL